MLTNSTLVTIWPMLLPSNLQHAAHKPHSIAQPPKKARVCADSKDQEATILKLCVFFNVTAESGRSLFKKAVAHC